MEGAPKGSSPRSARRRRGRPAGPNEALPPKRHSILELPAEPPAGLLEENPRDALSSSAPDHTRRWKHAKASADALARSIGGIDPVLAGVLSKSTGADPARLWPLLVEIGTRLAAGAWDWHLYEFPEEGEAGAAALYPVELPVEAPVRRMKDVLEALDARAAEVVMPSYVAHLRRKAAVQAGKALKRLERLGRNLEAGSRRRGALRGVPSLRKPPRDAPASPQGGHEGDRRPGFLRRPRRDHPSRSRPIRRAEHPALFHEGEKRGEGKPHHPEPETRGGTRDRAQPESSRAHRGARDLRRAHRAHPAGKARPRRGAGRGRREALPPLRSSTRRTRCTWEEATPRTTS